MLLIHVVSGSPKIVGDADSICCVMAGISTGIIVGATFLLAVWGYMYDNSICEKTGSSNVCVELPTGQAKCSTGSIGSV